MSIVPELSADQLIRIENAERAAAEMVIHARVHLDYAAHASKALESQLGTSGERFKLEEERDWRLDCTRRCIQLATSKLFDIVARNYWQKVFADVREFGSFLPQISEQVERSIACPELNTTVLEVTAEKRAEWLKQASREGDDMVVRLQYAEDVCEVLAEFREQYARQPGRRTELLKRLADQLVEVHLGGVLTQVNQPFQYGQFAEKVSSAKLFIAIALDHLNLKADDFVTARKFVSAKCDRLQARAAARARPRSTSDAPVPQGGRTVGRKPHVEFNHNLVHKISKFGTNWRAHLDELCEMLDEEGIPLPRSPKWEKLGCKGWLDVLEEDKEGLVKALQHRIEWVSRKPGGKLNPRN